MGITVAIGHSGADYETAMKCIENGAAACTHTCNAMKLFHQHFPSMMGAALESDIYCEAICDGRHLHPGSVRLFLKAKGYDKVVAVTDSIMAAGLPDGEYKFCLLYTSSVFDMIPFIMTILVLIITSMRSSKENSQPKSCGVNYFREER